MSLFSLGSKLSQAAKVLKNTTLTLNRCITVIPLGSLPHDKAKSTTAVSDSNGVFLSGVGVAEHRWRLKFSWVLFWRMR